MLLYYDSHSRKASFKDSFIMHIIPTHPTPAQQRLIKSDWFQAALNEVSTFEAHRTDEQTQDLETWTLSPWLKPDVHPNIFSTAEARLMATMHTLLAKGEATPQHIDYWASSVEKVCCEMLPMAVYVSPYLDTLKDLTIAMELLQPEDDRFSTSRKGLSFGAFGMLSDERVMSSLLEQAREDVVADTERAQNIKTRLAQASQLDEETSLRLDTLVEHFPKGNTTCLDIRFRDFQDDDPIAFLTRCFDCALEPKRGIIKPDIHAPGSTQDGWSPKNLLWYIVTNTFRTRTTMLGTMSRLISLLCHFVSLVPVRFTTKTMPFYMGHLHELFVDTDTFSTCAGLLAQSHQLPLAQSMIHPSWDKEKWSEVIAARMNSHMSYSFARGALQVWAFGQKIYRSDLMEAHIKEQASADDLLSVTLDVFDTCEGKLTPARQKMLLALFEQVAPCLDHAQQLAIAPGITSLFKGKTLKAMQAFAPDVDWATFVSKAAPKAKKAAPKQKPSKPMHAVLEGIKAKRLPAYIDASLAHTLMWRDEKRALNETEFGVLITALRESGPYEAKHTHIDTIIKALEASSLNDFGFKLLSSWENDGAPSKNKWMLFQLRHTGKASHVTKLGTTHDWSSWASAGKWAKAGWYLELIGDMGPNKASDKLFIELLDAGKVHSNLQMIARRIFPKFAVALGYANVQKYFQERGLLGHVPIPKPLSFISGEATLILNGEECVVLVEQAQIKLMRTQDHHKFTPSDDDISQHPTLQHHAEEIAQRALQWGAYYERRYRLSEPFTLKEATQALSTYGPVHQSIFCALLWQESTHHTLLRFDPEGTCFDVEYEPASISGKSTLQIVSFMKLKDNAKTQWLEHLTESEVILPFDLLDAGYYFPRLEQLIHMPLNSASQQEHSAVCWALESIGYRKGAVEDNGIIWEHYKTFPHHNLRVFFKHTGMDVGSDSPYETPGAIEEVRFTDLLGKTVPGVEVEPGALLDLYDELTPLLSLSP